MSDRKSKKEKRISRALIFVAGAVCGLAVCVSVLMIFAASGANILTINQTIPTNGCAGVTVSAETSDMTETMDELFARLTAAEGVLRFEIMAG